MINRWTIVSLLLVAGGCQQSSAPTSPQGEPPVVSAALVGNGGDYTASVSGTLSKVVGSFPTVTGVTSEVGSNGVANSYTFQVNSNALKYPSGCPGGLSTCYAWRQFIYSSHNASAVYIETWLKGFGSVSQPKTCPAGYMGTNGSMTTGDCGRDSPRTTVPNQPISNLSNLTLTGLASAGGNDTVILALGGTELGRAIESDNIDGLSFASSWNQAEFNIFGDTSSSPQAIFSPSNGVTIAVKLALTGTSTAAPTCIQTGTTFEMNNLNLVSDSCCPVPGSPATITFLQSNAGAKAPYCRLTVIATSLPFPSF